MPAGALSSSLSTWWRLILRILRTFKIWVRPPGRFICRQRWWQVWSFWQFKYSRTIMLKEWPGYLTISSVSEMYPMAVIWLFWARDSFCVARRFWLHCLISKKSWTLAIRFKFLSATGFFISELFPVFIESNSGSVPAKIPLLALANSFTTTSSRRVSPVVFDCLHPKTSSPREKRHPLRHHVL